MNVFEMLRLHMELECIRVNAAGDLARFPCPDPDDIHRLYIVRHAAGYNRYFRDDVPVDLRARLQQMPVESLFSDHAHVQQVFADYGVPCLGMHVGKSYVFPEDFELVADAAIDLWPENDLCQIVIDNAVVAACSSVRRNQHAAEAYVFTDERYQRQGFGKRVTQAWAQRVRASGRVPFYSHVIDNLASQRLAESLEFEWYIDDVGYE